MNFDIMTELKTPPRVLCIKNETNYNKFAITINKIYRVYDMFEINFDLYYAIVNDNGAKEHFSERFFIEIWDEFIKPATEIDINKYNEWVNNIVKL